MKEEHNFLLLICLLELREHNIDKLIFCLLTDKKMFTLGKLRGSRLDQKRWCTGLCVWDVCVVGDQVRGD